MVESRLSMARIVFLIAFIFAVITAAAATPTEAFDAANKLYFEGKFAQSAAAYQKLIETQSPTATLYYNLGNACFKAGQDGRAIAAYLRALQLNPRDPNVRFNLKFVREKVTGSDALVGSPWKRMLASLTLNEWTLLCAAVFWGWFLLMMLRELRPTLRQSLRMYVVLAASGTGFLALCLVAAYNQSSIPTAVIIQPEAIVRQGPLERSPVAFKLRDGIEVTVQDQQEISDQGQKQTWLRVEAPGHRVGWVKRGEVVRTQG